MSLDAVVTSVFRRDDGSGELRLSGRPAATWSHAGIPGRHRLRFRTSPPEVFALAGRLVRGDTDTILLGDTRIARRTGYTAVALEDGHTLRTAIVATTTRPTGIRGLWLTLLAHLRLDLSAVCQMSTGDHDYHDYPDSTTPDPWHFHDHTCRRCAKRFMI